MFSNSPHRASLAIANKNKCGDLIRSTRSPIGLGIGLGILLIAMTGCASTTSGTAALTAKNVDAIKKGVTTRHGIEAVFGPSQMVSMMSGGKHILSYSFSETNAHANWMCFVPILNWFMSGAEGQSETRSLQVNLDPRDVVEDYQFNDSMTDLQTSQGILGTSTNSTPVLP